MCFADVQGQHSAASATASAGTTLSPATVVGLFIKSPKINDKVKDSELSDDSLIRSSYSWKNPRVQYTI